MFLLALLARMAYRKDMTSFETTSPANNCVVEQQHKDIVSLGQVPEQGSGSKQSFTQTESEATDPGKNNNYKHGSVELVMPDLHQQSTADASDITLDPNYSYYQEIDI